MVFDAWDENRKMRVALKRSQKVGNKVSREYTNLKKLEGCENVVQLVDFYYTFDLNQRVIQN